MDRVAVTAIRGLAVAVVALLVACASAGGNSKSAPRTQLFILAGQSNMVGFGQPVPVETTSPSILRFSSDGSSAPAKDPVFPYDATYDGPTQPGVGPAMSFARAVVAANPAMTVGLVPCAASGTKIAEWQKGQPLYQACVAATNAAVAAGGQVAGVLFFQGESDSATADGVAAWPAAFKAFARDFRGDVGAPDARLVYAQLGTPPDNAVWHNLLPLVRQMQAAQSQIQQSAVVPNSAMIITGDLPYGVDSASAEHFSPWAYDVIGQRFAAAWQVAPPAVASQAPVTFARGTVTLTWPGGSTGSNPAFVNHPLGVAPGVVFAQASGTNEGIGATIPISATFSYTASSFGILAKTTDGSMPPAGAYDVFLWVAFP